MLQKAVEGDCYHKPVRYVPDIFAEIGYSRKGAELMRL